MATIDLEKIPLTTLRLMILSSWEAYIDSCDWVILDRQSKIIRRGKDLLDALPQCDEVEVVVPASIVSFLSAGLPSGSQAKILGALAFLVEEGLITAPEDSHAVLAEQSNSMAVIAVIQKSWVKRQLEKLARVGIFPVRMFPETLLPVLPNKGWAMVCRGQESFIRTSEAQGIPVDIDVNNYSAPFLLTLALQQCALENRPTNIAIYGELITHAAEWETDLDLILARPVQQEWFVSPAKPRWNLLQGEFQPSGGTRRRLSAFKPLIVTLATLIGLQFTLTLLDFALMSNENRLLNQAILTQYKATFPNANTVVDAPLQMQRSLEDLKHGTGERGDTDFISLLDRVTSSIGAVSTERLKSMKYQNSKLILSLLAPDMEYAEAMRKRLIDSGMPAIIEAPRKTEQGLEFQLSIGISAS